MLDDIRQAFFHRFFGALLVGAGLSPFARLDIILIAYILYLLLITVPSIREISAHFTLFSSSISLGGLDLIALGNILILLIIYAVTVTGDIRYYNRIDPVRKPSDLPDDCRRKRADIER